MEKGLWTCIHEMAGLQHEVENKYVLSYSNWNDYGFQTGFGLFLAMPQNEENHICNIHLGGLSIVEHAPITRGMRFFPREGVTNYTSFICRIETAERMYLTLTYDERMELIKKLRIRFDDYEVAQQENYRASTLRNTTREDFLARQKEIKELVMRQDDVSPLILKHFDIYSMKKAW